MKGPNRGINMAGWPKRECRSIDEPNRLILSQEVEDEYREAIFRPKFDRFASVDRRRRILDIVVFAAEKVEPSEAVRECRDPKDNKYLELAVAGGADVIVGRDVRHLLSMHPGAAFRSCLVSMAAILFPALAFAATTLQQNTASTPDRGLRA